ncbi:MAG: hypothetical protein AVDCRST_MAG77-5154 [uncultured Chloroflexi bacterium]|uniref:S1 motif domain-containing protein n=1 Tax=uncultured Chloroflexota bacterium TaxID=166587 RepID=A0A6J4K416_9CHLR|nr:MAG: hypothetical protein AVDCRST_MAG77-5154 [uncultured Chloroflexota bacterium]
MESRFDADGTQSAVPPQPRAGVGAAPESLTESAQSPGGGGARGGLGGAAVDEEALRGTRFEFGGRRPYAFTPPRVDTTRQAGRPLPGIGTVALGRVARITAYGAFVDFLGFRGLVHISQLLPGHRVERVEDVVQDADEVQVRVIGVDPERRHINLALVARLSPGTVAAAAQAGEVAAMAEQAAAAAAGTTETTAASPSEEAHAANDAGAGLGANRPSESAPPPTTEPPVAAATGGSAPQTRQAEPAPRELAEPAPRVQAEPRRTTRPEAPLARPAVQQGGRTATGPRIGTPRPATPLAGRPGTARPGSAQPAAGAQPSPAEIARHGARAIRRELMDPRHPMARLLNAAPRAVMGRGADKDRLRPGEGAGDDGPGTPPPPQVMEPPRPVHVSGPEPEPQPSGDQPATLEDLAARFGQARPKAADRSAGMSDRSRQEREKQAAILAKLRGGTPAT